MKKSRLVVISIFAIVAVLSCTSVVYADVTGGITAEKGGVPVTSTLYVGDTVQLVCTYINTAPSPPVGTGTVYYRFSEDGVTFGDLILIGTLHDMNPDGTSQSMPFTLPEAGFFRFVVHVYTTSPDDYVSASYPSVDGSIPVVPPPPVPEAPPIFALGAALVAVGVFVIYKKRTKQQPA